MMKDSVLIESAEMPNILIDGIKYELLCEFEAKAGGFQSLYVKENGRDVFVKIGRDNAIVGLFATEENKLKQLFDYIEATISKDDGMVCYESESFPRFLQLAVSSGSHYPVIENNIGPQDRPAFFRFIQQLRPQLSLDKAFREQILSHTIPVKYREQAQIIGVDSADHEDGHADTSSERLESRHIPAENLPNGWTWTHWEDGSGVLKSPDGVGFFPYDRVPYGPDGIEYVNCSGSYDIYWGNISEFQKFAESTVSKEVLQAKDPLSEKIEYAASRSASNTVGSSVKDKEAEPSR